MIGTVEIFLELNTPLVVLLNHRLKTYAMEFVDKRDWMSGSRIKFTPIDLCPEFLPSLPHPRAHFELPSEKKKLSPIKMVQQ